MNASFASLPLILLTWSTALHGAGLKVTTAEDQMDTPSGPELSLREAIRDAGVNYLIYFDNSLSGSTIELLHGPLLIPHRLTIDGSGFSGKITIDAQQLFRSLEVAEAPGSHSQTQVTIKSLIFQNGQTSDGLIETDNFEEASGQHGGALLNHGNLLLSECEFINNRTGNGGSYIIDSSSDETTAIFGGNGGSGGAIGNLGNLEIEHCVFENNTTGPGGDSLSSTIETSPSDFSGYSGDGGCGGAIYNSGFLSIESCTFSSNSTGTGGASEGDPIPSDFFSVDPITGAPDFEQNGNGNGGCGGALCNDNISEVSLSEFIQNSTGSGGISNSPSAISIDPITGELLNPPLGSAEGGDGGALHNAGETRIKKCAFFDNSTGEGGAGIGGNIVDPITGQALIDPSSAGGHGGAISNMGTASLVSASIANNKTGDGGFFRSQSQAFDPNTGVPVDCETGNGGSGGHGGAIYNTEEFTLAGCTIVQNATGNGGAGLPDGSSGLAINSPPLLDGIGGDGGDGGAIWNSNSCRIYSSTLSQNSTGLAGSDFGDPCFTFDPITGAPIANSGRNGLGGGLYYSYGNALEVCDSIISNNSSSEAGPDIFSYFSIATTGANIVTDLSYSNLDASPNVIVANPRLAPFDYYGQITPSMPLLPGSPAIDSAGPPTNDFLDLDDDNSTSEPTPYDQRGLPRIIGAAADIGAVEFQGRTEGLALLNSLWNEDTDKDESPFGVEFSLGSDPFTADTADRRNLSGPSLHETGQATLTFGIDAAASNYTSWILKRSTSLAPASFQEIYRLDGPTMTETLQPGFDSSYTPILAPTSVTITDQSPPAGKAFYRFEAELAP